MVLLPFGFLESLCPGIMDMINNQNIEHMTPPTPPRDTEPLVGSPISLSPSSSVGSSSPVRSTTPPPNYPFDESIFAELDNSLWIIPRPLKSEPVLEEPNEMAPKRTSTSIAPAMTQATIKKLVADSVAAALEAQASTMENTDYTNRNTGQRGTPIARKCTYKEFMSCQPFNFKALCPTMVPNSEKLIEVFIGGLPRSIEGNVTTSKPQTLEEAITITQRTLHCQVSDIQQGGSSDQELQKQRVSHWKQPTTTIRNLSCLWKERALQKLVPKAKQQCPWKSILAER
ncbi:hypothetical protein Tco_0753587 [Tanacetum coccineum]